MIQRIISIALLVPAFLLAACAGSSGADATRGTLADATTDGHGYSLLYATIKDEGDVDKILIIKRPSTPVSDVIKAIGGFARAAKSNLEILAKDEPAVALDRQALPTAEADTREAISGTTSKHLLVTGGKGLEFDLLLTQHDALNYLSHLAGVIAKDEPNENRKRFLTQFKKDAESLHQAVVTLMRTPYAGSGESGASGSSSK